MHRDGCVLVLYAGAESNPVATLARWVAAGAASCPGTEVSLVKAIDASKEQLQSAGAVVLGTGDFNGHPEPELLTCLTGLCATEWAALMDGAVCAGFCTAAGSGQHLLESLARTTATLGAVYVGGSGKECTQGVFGEVQVAAGDAWSWRQDQERLQAQARDLGRRVACIASFYPSAYRQARTPNHQDEEEQGMTPYWLCFCIVLALLAVVLFQRR